MILTIRTDRPEAEIGLRMDGSVAAQDSWHAHRALAETLHRKIRKLLDDQGKKDGDITGIVVYKGPGSFTGLRIGISVANALAYSLDIPVVSQGGEAWVTDGMKTLLHTQTGTVALPEYGAPVRTTTPKK